MPGFRILGSIFIFIYEFMILNAKRTNILKLASFSLSCLCSITSELTGAGQAHWR